MPNNVLPYSTAGFNTALTLAITVLLSQNLIACKPNTASNQTANPSTNTATNPATSQNFNQASNVNGSQYNHANHNQNNHANHNLNDNANPNANTASPTGCNNQAIYAAYQQHNPNQKTEVLGCGQVIKVLKDDTDGTPHQKFLMKIDGYPQMTVLVAHNIDLASRVDNLRANTPIRFYGEYIYNDKGGVLHWTHKDPAARHQSGWLEYNGQKYW